ncbi:hypothetical protein DMH04_55895 [Kibdelosporangium aridum]|uniref:Allene oxide cyclase barrel-like domain-containing protein n=1 Tax=Kibdelosporangium aridum TaxID=2030 RepID=A0A428XTR9_KIBAR|nr:hypothetical protein [Kibdelosporangium aridum]RSM58700.1 hypothetical protein DMH04_55895 [Kibdelosporangium aridum]
MPTTISRRVFTRFLGLLLAMTAVGLISLTAPRPATAAEVSPQAVCTEYVRVYNAATRDFMGSDFNKGATVSIFRLQNMFFFGDNLLPTSRGPRPFFRFLNTSNGDVRTYQPGVSDNGVMRDDNRDYTNRIVVGTLLYVGNWQVDASYVAECGLPDTQFLGNLQVN